MKHLMNREDYIKEYLRKTIENEGELNEGLMGTLFGGLKMLLKKDWDNVKCKNPSVIKYLQDIDKSLQGYTMTKMQFSGECTTIRQNVANYFSDILDYKLKQVEKNEDPNKFLEKEEKEKEENKDAKGVAKTLNIVDKTILDSVNKYKENISSVCKKSPKLREYADQMLNSVDVFVNDQILNKLEEMGIKKEKLEELRKKNEERESELEAIRKKMDDAAKGKNEEDLKKMNKEREDLMRGLGVSPISTMAGDKAIDTIIKPFNDIMSELKNVVLNESVLSKYENILKNDNYIGVKNSFEKITWTDSKKKIKSAEVAERFLVKVILSKIYSVFNVVANNDNKKLLQTASSQSVQAMMIALSNAVIYGFMGEKFPIDKNDNIISLFAKCAIDSDATIGFNLPLMNADKPDNGNIFVNIMNALKETDNNSKEIEDAVESIQKDEMNSILKGLELYKKDMKYVDGQSAIKDWGVNKMKEFKQNITHLFDIIVKKAKDIKETAEKEREAEAQKAQQQSDAEENNKE